MANIARRNGAPKTKVVHNIKGRSITGPGRTPRPTIGILWPRGNRGK